MCTENKIPEKPFDFFFFFSFLQVARSLEDHSSEVQVVKHLLHLLAHASKKHPASTRCQSSSQNTLGGVQRVCQVQKMVQVFRCSLFSMEIPQPQTSLVSVLFTNVLLGTGADHSRRGWVNQGNIHSLAAVLGANDLCHSFWSGLTQQLPWKSMWVGRSSLKALRTENVHGVVQSRPFLK